MAAHELGQEQGHQTPQEQAAVREGGQRGRKEQR